MQLQTDEARAKKVLAYDTAKERGIPVYLRHERREGWTGSLPFYVRWCDDCQVWSETYPQSHSGKIRCKNCRSVMYLHRGVEVWKQLTIFGLWYAPTITHWLLRMYVKYTGTRAEIEKDSGGPDGRED